jgi:hypothetical protein
MARVGWRSAAPLGSLLLDVYSVATAAYSLRKIRTAYTGNAITVRRSSDNTSQDIGFDKDGNLDTVSLLLHVGSGNGFVTIWYDQSGNNKHVVQTTAASQPKIVNAGSVMTKNGKPAIDFTWGQFLRAEQRVIGVSQTSLFNVFSIKSLTDRNFAWDIGNSYGNQYFAFDINTWGTSGQKFGFYASGAGFDSTASTNLNQNLISIIANNAWSNNVKANTSYYINNTLRTLTNSTTVYPDYSNAGRISIGNLNGENYYFNGTHQEFIIYPVNQTTNRSAIESNINSYYSIY